MDEMKWSSSRAFLGVLAANKLGFGFALAEICKTYFLASDSAKRAWHVQNQPHTVPSSCMVTSLIGPIYG
jgi:hypothetical protein